MVVKLSTLHIDRFGARSNLHLENLSERLNVIYGPNGSGKTTMIQFLRWTLFGNPDGQSARYLAAGAGPAEGTIHVQREHQPQVISRRDDGTSVGQLRIQHPVGPQGWRTDSSDEWFQGPLSDVDPREFDLIFTVEFERTQPIQDLISVARRRGIELTYDHRQLDQLAQLQARADQLRQQIERHVDLETGLAALQQRRASVARSIETLHAERRQWEEQWNARRQELQQQLAHTRGQRESLAHTLDRLQQLIDARRHQAQQDLEQAERLRDEAWEQRRRRIEEIDQQTGQWQQVLDQLRQRYQALQSRLAAVAPSLTAGCSPEEEIELRFLLQTLGYRQSDIDTDLREMQQLGIQPARQTELTYIRDAFGSALETMRHDVTRLCFFLDQHHNRQLHQHLQAEIGHLRRMERELTDLIDQLAQQRDELTLRGYRSPWQAAPRLLTPESDYHYPLSAADPAWRQHSAPPRHDGLDERGPLRWHPLVEARLRQLTVEQDELRAQLRHCDATIENLQRQLTDWEHRQRYGWDASQLERLQADLQHIDQQIRVALDQQRLRQELSGLEEQIRRLHESLRESDVVRHAASILRTMTHSQHSRLRIAQDGQLWVDDGHQQWIAYEQLSRGTRDQVYLSLCLALAETYRHQGIELPLLLNDIFVNIDSDRARDTATALEAFAQRGHQLIVFTRHEHILQLFRPMQARLYVLKPRLQDEPAARREPIAPPRVAPPQPPVISPIHEAREPQPRPAHDNPLGWEPRYHWVARWREPVNGSPSNGSSGNGRTIHNAVAPTRTAVAPPQSTVVGGPAETALRTPPRSPVASTERTVASSPATPAAVATHELRESSSIEHLAGIDAQCCQALHVLGVHNVREFLSVSPSYAEEKLHDRGITADLIRRWQAEAALQVHARLTDREARLLIGCGIDSTGMLASLEVDAVARRLDSYLGSSDMQRIFGTSRDFPRPRISRWIESAREHVNAQRPIELTDTAEPRAVREARAPRIYREQATEIAPRPTVSRPDATAADTVTVRKPERPASQQVLRFFLEPSDPVVDAPGIGPKTAEQLHQLGIQTVADLLRVQAEPTATQLGQPRLTAEVVRHWQHQATLVCRVPNLRSHEAQILVACGLIDAEQLAHADAEALWQRVDQYCTSAEGRRLLRNGKKPELSQVAQWVQWARSARQLRAA